MIKEIPPEIESRLLAVIREAGAPDGSVHFTPVRICDNPDCPDRNREVFPYHVRDRNGKLWEDLCNPCFDALGCSYGPIELCPVCFQRPPTFNLHLAMFEGEVVDPETAPEWAGFPVCRECFEAHGGRA